jgi:hypothetical protein
MSLCGGGATALGQKYEPPARGSALRPRRGRGLPRDRFGMAEMIVAFLGTTAWVGGVLVLVVMATLPLLEHMAESNRR